jgi:Protein of unknown function (DUF3800)
MNDVPTGAPELHSLQAEMLRPGRTLVFIDDSGTPEQPLGEHLVKDYKLHAAAVLSSDAYRSFLSEHQEFLSRHPWADEFHTVDVFQGRRGAWAAQSDEVRQRAFNTMAGHFGRFVERVLYINVGVEQYQEIIEGASTAGAPSPANWNWNSHSEKARAALLKAIGARTRLPHPSKPLVVVEDADGQHENVCEVMYKPEANIFAGGVFRVDSKKVPGIQLADMAAYCFNRLHHVRAKLRTAQPPREMDPAVMRFLMTNVGKYHDVLSSDPSQYEKRRERNQKKRQRRAR